MEILDLFDLLTQKLDQFGQRAAISLQGLMRLNGLFTLSKVGRSRSEGIVGEAYHRHRPSLEANDVRMNGIMVPAGLSTMIHVNQSELFPALVFESCIALEGLRRAHLGLTGRRGD